MADALLGVVVQGVLSKVLSLATEEIGGVLGVRKDLQSLAGQLEMIQALLSDAAGKSSTSKAVELWLNKLEDVAMDADNLLDEIAYQVLYKEMQKGKVDKVRGFFSSSNPLVFRVKMASEIKRINLCLNEIFKVSMSPKLLPAPIT